MVGGHHAFVESRTWAGELDAAPERDLLTRLGARYLAGHAPADARDLAKWAGIPISAAQTALADVPVPQTAGPRAVEPRLLGAFDPLLHGWASREALLAGHRGVVTSNGIFRPVVLVDGRVVGTWALPDGIPAIRLTNPVSRRLETLLLEEAADVLRFLGLPARPARITSA
jgi:hypothetical protein